MIIKFEISHRRGEGEAPHLPKPGFTSKIVQGDADKPKEGITDYYPGYTIKDKEMDIVEAPAPKKTSPVFVSASPGQVRQTRRLRLVPSPRTKLTPREW